MIGWLGIMRLGLVQAALGAIVVLVTSTLNRVMIVELALPAIVPGVLVALHYAVQVMRPRFGFASDVGGRRTPWIVGGMAMLALGATGAAASTASMAAFPVLGVAGAALSFLLVGLGVGAAGTSLLTLLAARVDERRRAAAASIVWIMMIAGIVLASIGASVVLSPFSVMRLVAVVAGVSGAAFVMACLAVWGMEGPGVAAPAARHTPFLAALRDVWDEPAARRFAIFVFVSMLAYSAQELVIEPFAGRVFGLSPAASAALTGLHHGGVLVGMAAVALGTVLLGGYRRRAMRVCTMGGCIGSALAVLALAACGLAGPEWSMRAAVAGLGVMNGVFAVSAIGAMMGLAGGSGAGEGGRAGTRMGLWGAAQAIAFGAGGLFGTAMSDAARLVFGQPALAYAAVFSAEALLFLAAAGLAAGVFGEARQQQTEAFA